MAFFSKQKRIYKVQISGENMSKVRQIKTPFVRPGHERTKGAWMTGSNFEAEYGSNWSSGP